MVSTTTQMDKLSLTFSALAHPIRRNILNQLKVGKATVKQLSKPFNISAPAVTKHLKVLENAGLIDRSYDKTWRFAELDASPLKEISEWVNEYKVLWSNRLDQLEEYVETLKLEKKDESKTI